MKANVKNEAFFLKLVEDGRLLIQADGTVLNTKTLKVYRKPSTTGHIQIGWKVNGKTKHILVHRLIYLAVKGPLRPDEQVMHLDGIKSNNRPSNLEKTTNAGNVQHAYKIGLIDRNSITNGLLAHYDEVLPHNCNLTDPQVIEIRNRFVTGTTRYRLSKEFKIEWRMIDRIVRGLSYRAVKLASIKG